MACAFIDYLVDEWIRVIIFQASGIEVMIINANTYGALFFVNEDGVGYPRGVFDWVYEAARQSLSISTLIARDLVGHKGCCFSRMGDASSHVSLWCSMMEGSIPDIYMYVHVKMIDNSWKRALYCTISLDEHDAPSQMCSTQSRTTICPL